ncbi:MAG: CHAD domain-containing protein [Solirubrobacteraceae bacterium]|nr:CHAD domain-containing protein [Solirubrobacteraceae bacterium]
MDIARNIVDAARNLAASPPDPERAYLLRPDEHVPDGIRRIARGQLQDARDDLDGTSSRRLGETVHETRKRIKRLRACVRLARDAIGEARYESENSALKTAARRISAPRDAQVLVETLDAVTERFGDELAPDATAALRARLDAEKDAATAALDDDGGRNGNGAIAATIITIDHALSRTTTWTFEPDGIDALSPGLRRIYRRGRRAMQAARKDPSAEHLHEWRKRVKDLWHATEIVQCARPKRLERFAGRAHKLSGLLGDHHDLHVLREYVAAHPQCFTAAVDQQALLAVIDRRSRRLGEKALARGRKLYKPKPKRFVRHIERGWRERAATSPKPQAG